MQIIIDNQLLDTFTGEVSELYTVTDSSYHLNKDYEESLDWAKVCSKHDLEAYFQSDIHNPRSKIRWTNDALDTLLGTGTDITEKYSKLAKMIVARNFVFDTNDNISSNLGIDKSNLARVLSTMQNKGLLRTCSFHNGGRKYKKIVMNPTLVFKTYNQQGDEFNSSLAFSQVHQLYIDKWITSLLESQEMPYI